MLINGKDLLDVAHANNFAVPAFNISDWAMFTGMTRRMVSAAEGGMETWGRSVRQTPGRDATVSGRKNASTSWSANSAASRPNPDR